MKFFEHYTLHFFKSIPSPTCMSFLLIFAKKVKQNSITNKKSKILYEMSFSTLLFLEVWKHSTHQPNDLITTSKFFMMITKS